MCSRHDHPPYDAPDALLRALERLADRADEYRHAVADANRYLNEDLPSAKALVFALGSARAALRRLVDEYDEDVGRPPSFTSMDEARAALAATPPASAERDAVWPSTDDKAAVEALAVALAGCCQDAGEPKHARHVLERLRAAEARE
jgi:hypothetical protein